MQHSNRLVRRRLCCGVGELWDEPTSNLSIMGVSIQGIWAWLLFTMRRRCEWKWGQMDERRPATIKTRRGQSARFRRDSGGDSARDSRRCESRFRSIRVVLIRIASESREILESPPEAIHNPATIQLNRAESWLNRDSGPSESRCESRRESALNRPL